MTANKPAKKVPAKAGAPAESSGQKLERKRDEARGRAAAEREWLERNVAGTGRLRGRPSLYVRPFWELTEHERSRFDQVHGVTKMVTQILHKVHQADRELIFNAIGATVGFHELSKLIESLDSAESLEDIRSDLEHVRVGFDLALQALDASLKERGFSLDRRKEGGLTRWKNDPRSKAMAEIRETWEKAGRPGAAAFARKVHGHYAGTITSERSIENAIGRWLKEESSD